MRLTTGPMRSSSEDLVGTFELGAACAGAGHESATTVGRGRGAAGGGRGAAEAIGLGASQEPVGTCEAAAALPTVVVRTVGPDEDGKETVADGRGTEGKVSLAVVGAEAAMSESTFPTGVFRTPENAGWGWSPVHPFHYHIWKEGWVPGKVRPPI